MEQVRFANFTGRNVAANVFATDPTRNVEEVRLDRATHEAEIDTLKRLQSSHIVNILGNIVHQPNEVPEIVCFQCFRHVVSRGRTDAGRTSMVQNRKNRTRSCRRE